MTKVTPSSKRLKGFRRNAGTGAGAGTGTGAGLAGGCFAREFGVLFFFSGLGGDFGFFLFDAPSDSASSSERSTYAIVLLGLGFFDAPASRAGLTGTFASVSSSERRSSYSNRPVALRRPPVLTGDTSTSL